jgi:pimeloyl-ACP methyl ester carboxylesterase
MGIDAKGFFLKRGHADMLRTRGYNVLLFDFNGFGESEEGGFSYPDDLVSAARAAQAEWPGARVGVLGLSFGAGWAICALSRPDPGFQVLVAECPFTTLDEFWIRHRGAYLALQVFNRIMPGIAANLRPIAHIGAARTPMRLMLVYGSHDDVTPPSMGARFVEACTLPASSVEMWISPLGEHTKILPADPGLYEERVVGFFDRAFGHAAASPA